MASKYGCVAEQNNLWFIPAVFSHTSQIHDEFKILVKEQIKQNTNTTTSRRLEVPRSTKYYCSTTK